MKTAKDFIRDNIFLSATLVLLVILAILYPREIPNYHHFVDWRTIIDLTGLLILTTGLKESGFFRAFSRRVLKRIRSERGLAVFLILLTAILSTFLTNDITLFIVIPLTMSVQSLIKNDVSKLVIFEAISANVGSTLTPVGNPQNLFLWHQWGISFITFTIKMSPLVLILALILLLFAWLSFPDKRVEFSERIENNLKPTRSLFFSSLVLIAIYLFSLEIGRSQLVLPIIFLIYLIFFREVLLKTDWLLLVMFIVMFIDFHIVSTVPFIVSLVHMINLHHPGNVFWLSVATSQLISNVPASIFVSKFSHNWHAVSYGVNVGGNGIVIGSLANIIALRMAKNRKIFLDFHKYSIPYLLITGGITYVLFFYL